VAKNRLSKLCCAQVHCEHLYYAPSATSSSSSVSWVCGLQRTIVSILVGNLSQRRLFQIVRFPGKSVFLDFTKIVQKLSWISMNQIMDQLDTAHSIMCQYFPRYTYFSSSISLNSRESLMQYFHVLVSKLHTYTVLA
jgi:hypothetical protein